MPKDLKVEILAVGNWTDMHGTEFSVDAAKLKEIAHNFSALEEVIDVNLKFGHNNEQPLTDGQPKLGHVSKVWEDGKTLFAMFSDMPKIVHDAIKKKLYDNVSIEALLDVSHKGVDYGTVLTAVSLLGMDIPAVKTLADLQTYMAKGELAFSGHATLSKQPIKLKSEGSTMNAEEQAKMDRLEATNKAQGETIADDAKEKVKLSKAATDKQTEIDGIKEEGKKAAFTSAKAQVETDLESLVKLKKIAPSKRDHLIKECTEKNIESVQFTIETLKENTEVIPGKEQGKKTTTEGNDDLPVDQQVMIAAKKVEFESGGKLSYSQSVRHVMDTDPKLAREYADFNDLEEA